MDCSSSIYDIAHRFLSPAIMHYMAEQIHDEPSSMFTLFNDVLHHIVLPVISITLSHTSDKPYTTDVCISPLLNLPQTVIPVPS